MKEEVLSTSTDAAKDLTILGGEVREYPGFIETFPKPDHTHTVRLVCDGEVTARCLDGRTRIDVATNESLSPDGVPIEELVGKEGYVFSFDLQTSLPVVRRFHSVRQTSLSTPLVRVKYTLYKGRVSARREVIETLVCTPDHPILVRRGRTRFEWIEARNLETGDSLVADQRHDDSIRDYSRHRLVMESVLGRRLTDEEVVHHIDKNHSNNTPQNLSIQTNSSHSSLHRRDEYGYDKTLDRELIVELWNEGVSLISIARRIGCDSSTIRSRFEEMGLTARTRQESYALKTGSRELLSKKIRAREMYESGKTLYEISEVFDVHPTTAAWWVRDSGGEVRTSLETKLLSGTIRSSDWEEARCLYDRGYSSVELGKYFSKPPTTIQNWVIRTGGTLRSRQEAARLSRVGELPSLNHKVVSVEDWGEGPTYNMEVDGTECFFGNSIVLHNCPKTGQPDFYDVDIEYHPKLTCIESKSLKLYFVSFREQGQFIEQLANTMAVDLFEACEPYSMTVKLTMKPRGGIAITAEASVFCPD